MSAALKLAAVTTEFISVLTTETGHPAGDGVSPISGQAAITDFPYYVVNEVTDREDVNSERTELLGAAGHLRVVWQIRAVGKTRLQASSAIDEARVMLDPSIAVATVDARVEGREDLGTEPGGPDDPVGTSLFNKTLRLECLVVGLH